MENKDLKQNGLILTGEVVSAKNTKTVIVRVTNITKHPLYQKAVKKMKRYAVHNEIAGVVVGDMVKIREIKPVSKTKHFAVLERMAK
jgi:small subunit ribosomal protein S17